MNRLIALSLLILTLVAASAVADDGNPLKGKPALVVMDIQNVWLPYMDDEGKDLALRTVNATIQSFEKQGLPIIYVFHTDPVHGPPVDSEDFALPESVIVADGAVDVVKNHPSGFRQTELEQILSDHGCDTVFLVGLSATGCVLATYWDAVGLDLRTFMVKNALMSHKTELTHAVEEITGAVTYQAMQYMLEHAPR